MSEDVHFIPVGFDFERLIRPISSDGLPANRVFLFHSVEGVGDSRAEELVDNMMKNLEQHLDLLNVDVTKRKIDDIFNYDAIYQLGYNMMHDELENGNRIFVNISSMPRTVAFAFATAASSIVIEDPDLRNSVFTYYVAANHYLVLDMITKLKDVSRFLEKRFDKSDDPQYKKHKDGINDVIEQYRRHGVTKGVQELGDTHFVEIPTPPTAALDEIEQDILTVLHRDGKFPSINQLAEAVADFQQKSHTDTFNSKIRYNVEKLEDKGYATGEKDGLNRRIEISKMGTLWVITHEQN